MKPRIVVAGQVPPPFGGQNIMIQKALAQFARAEQYTCVHLPFFFTPDVKAARKGGFRKAGELFRVIGRLLRIRSDAPIDLLLYPVGGPQRIPMIRDLLLLPWILLFATRVVLHFHAAGIAEQLQNGPDKTLAGMVAFLYRRAFAAIVMTKFNRRDPDAVGMPRIMVLPHRIEDEFDPALLARGRDSAIRLLYVGHLCGDKGTPQLLEAFARVCQDQPDLELHLVGECLPPFNSSDLNALIDRLGIRSRVRTPGVLSGRAKAEAFGSADVFVFPTVAPYESFGLVLIEAMSWKLPIVASHWRGNSDVLTSAAGGLLFETDSLTRNLSQALQQALENRHQWNVWGVRNRSIFEQLYLEKPAEAWLMQPLEALLPRKA